MFVGEVIGHVVSTVKWPGLTGLKLLLVRPYGYNELLEKAEPNPKQATSQGVVVVDVLDAGVGDRVVVAYGHAARVAVEPSIAAGEKPPHPIDAAIVAVVDDFNVYEGA